MLDRARVVRENVRLIAIGMVMGAAEVVPGVSGGTIAFISGVYERLVEALRQFTPYLLVQLGRHGLKSVWTRVDANFLLALFGGMGISILLFASLVTYLLSHQPIGIWSFFTGLVIASTWVVYRQIEGFGADLVLATATGAAVGLIVTSLVPLNLEPTPLFIFVGGAVAVCAWILPGLSGSFILLVLGLYAFVIDAIHQRDIVTLAILAAGCAVGLVSFSQILSRLFRHFRNETLAVLTGFMVGSLIKLWPWKETLSYQLRDDGSQIPLVQEPVLPHIYADVTGNEPQILVALICALAGFGLVLIMNRLANAPDRLELD